jgi:hypothetical protein
MKLPNDREQGSSQNLFTALAAPEKTMKSEQYYILVQSAAFSAFTHMEKTLTQLSMASHLT